jgi:hypothetical protein
MDDLQHALSTINEIRHQLARGSQFRGYGPPSIALSGILALAVATGESAWDGAEKHDLKMALVLWISTALISVAFSTVDTIRRARQVHVELAPAMLHAAVEQFVPSITVGALLTAVLVGVMPDEGWLLPGLWEMIFSLGIFASCRFLPRPMFAVGVWYLAAGLCSICICSGTKTFLPWAMGVPFGIGQLLVAAVLQVCVEENTEDI